MQIFTEPVERGAKLLDREIPDWYTRIDTDILDISSSTNCILGQILGEPMIDWLRKVNAETDPDRNEHVLAWNGFNVTDVQLDAAYATDIDPFDELRNTWLAVIAAKKDN